MQPLPVDGVLDDLLVALGRHGAAVLTAPPGSGKSTRVPPALLDPRLLSPDHPRVVLLQPRRVAAVSIARRIADERGWRLGEEIGYRIRFERVGTERTRLWVETEGTLTRQLLRDPYLEGVGAVVLDEFHERSLHADLALAHLVALRRSVRPDLKVLAMSATMAAAPVAAFLGGPVLEAPAGEFTVKTAHLPGGTREPVAAQVARALDQALTHDDCGDVLVFLAGAGEISACERELAGRANLAVLPLHGSLPPEAQQRALDPDAAGRRKVILATNVAETSLTIAGVRTVIDSGLARVARWNPDTGLDELRLEPISAFSAAQRQGRAGRTADGRCLKLWSKLEDARRKAATEPEIRRVDLAGLLPAAKRLHGGDLRTFPWFESPETERLEAAEALLCDLGFTTAPHGALTPRGALLSDLPLHPRLGRLLLEAVQRRCPALGVAAAALLHERDLRVGRDRVAPRDTCDLVDRLECLVRARAANFHPRLRDEGIDSGAARQVDRAIAQIRQQAGDLLDGAPDDRPAARDALPALLLAGWPDRVAVRSSSDANRIAAVGGVHATIPASSCLRATGRVEAPALLVAHAVQGFGGRSQHRCELAMGVEITEALLHEVFPTAVVRSTDLRYVPEKGRIVSAAVTRYRDLVLRYAEGVEAEPAALAACLAAGLAGEARALIEAHDAARGLLQRWAWLRGVRPDAGLPEPDDDLLRAVLGDLCQGRRSRAEVAATDPLPLLEGRLTWEQRRRLDDWAPERWELPTGNQVRLDYSGPRPVLAVRLQELFGRRDTPRLAGGTVPVLLHLLAPNQRPQQITDDLAGFWERTYATVRKDLRARYPKHSWPDDPLTAPPECKGRRG